jgi:surface protein
MGKCQSNSRKQINYKKDKQKNDNEYNITYTKMSSKKSIDNSIPFEPLSYIYNQKENVFNIIKDDKTIGTGFLCLIPYPSKLNQLPALITCYHIFEIEDLKPGKKINLGINNNISKILNIDETRKMYISKERDYDIVIIEIKKEDEFNINNMLDIDYDFYEEEEKIEIYKNQKIYILYNSNKLNSFYSISSIKRINHKTMKIKCSSDLEEHSLGAPIINLKNFKVIGILIGKHKNKEINFGTIIKEPIESFNELRREKTQKNYIIITLNIAEKDINKDIYFLNNEDNSDKEANNSNYNLDELNETNAKLYINNKEYKFKKFFNPEKEGVYTIKIELNILLENCYHMFYKCSKITNIDLSLFNSKNITDMNSMFGLCNNLTSINLTNFDTKKVSNMQLLFQGCLNLTSLDLSSFDTRNVNDLTGMFSCCSKLRDVNLTSFNISKVKDMSEMFYWCPKLVYLDLSSFNIRNDSVVNMSKMFICCNDLKIVKLNKNFYQMLISQNTFDGINFDII